MAILDADLTFTGTFAGATGGIQSGQFTDAPTTGTQDCSNIVDLGITGGIPASAAGGGGARDIGIGRPLWLSCYVTAALTGGTSLQIELQGAPDAGSNAPGSWTVMWLSSVFAEATLIAGAQLANIAVPRAIFEQVLPRFLKLTCISIGSHGAGTIEAQIILDREDQIIGSTGAMSGYPAGINIAN